MNLPASPSQSLSPIWTLVGVSSDALANAVLALDNQIYASIPIGAFVNPNILCVSHKGETVPAICPANLPGGTTIFCSSDVAVALIVAFFTTF